MSATPKSDKNASDSDGPGSKPRGGKLARRARSFKEDFLEKLSQMRSPGGGGGGGGGTQRSCSPHSPKARAAAPAKGGSGGDTTDAAPADKNPLSDLHAHVKQVHVALKHFRDVVSKNKLEMLPGNGTVVLDTVTTIHGVLKMYVLNEQSSTLLSATNQVYQSLAKLIKLCDDVLLHGDKALDRENVAEVVQVVEEAVQNLVSLAQDQIANRETNIKSTANHVNHYHLIPVDHRSSSYALDIPHRNSLPDIPLTPRERQILEQTSVSILDRPSHNSIPHSQSSESILNDLSPPPKPPLPNRLFMDGSDAPPGEPPPLPPKRRNKPHHNQSSSQQQYGDMDNSAHDDSAANSSLTDTLNSSSNTGLAASFDRISLRSKSPEDTSSCLSASAGSLDSVLNHSREEEEIQVLMDSSEDTVLASDNILAQGSAMMLNGSSYSCWDSSSSNTSIEQAQMLPASQKQSVPSLDSARKSPLYSSELTPAPPGTTSGLDAAIRKLDHLSSSQAESGFASMHSVRSSSQSYTASSVSSQQFSSSVSRSSQQSSVSYSSSEASCSKSWQLHKTSTTTSETNVNSTSSSTTSQQHHVTSSDSISTSVVHRSESTVAASSLVSRGSDSIASVGSSEDTLSLLDKEMPSLSPVHDISTESPPLLPQKTRSKRRKDRQVSQYDNVPTDETDLPLGNHQEQRTVVTCSTHQALQQQATSRSPDNKPPPLPLKKKHIMAYMEMFGNCSHANTNEFLRHSVHTYNLLQAEWQQQEMSLTSTQSCSFSVVSSHSSQMFPSTPAASTFPPVENVQTSPSPVKEPVGLPPVGLPPALPPKRSRTASVRSASSPPPMSPPPTVSVQSSTPKENSRPISSSDDEKKVPLRRQESKVRPAAPEKSSSVVTKKNEVVAPPPPVNPLEELEISSYLVMKKTDEEGPDVRGGHPDALIIHATKANKNEENETDFMYQEAFLTTYRTFLSPLELIRKLCHRHQRFSCSSDLGKQRAAREAFSLLVRVVSDLTMSDLDDVILQTLMEFVYQLLCSGDLTMAKALRVKILEKYNAKKMNNNPNALLSSLNIYTRQASLLDFKSEQIAEQMTLLDADLFMKIEIPEVLIWAQEQNEERSPNLTRFTEHFNKMSYWARSRILEQNEAKDREKYVVKFIKIMKHLRKINNFNSYLALLSALDSAPIRRLEWQKHITEGLKEYCALIDSSSSFRAYRQALGETQPPCIPYIGLVLQDLTFVHIGNNDLLLDGSINFSKRWQQFNIVENMKRFKKGTYPYKKHERIIAFFNNFDEFLSEEAMWQISESIKPRGGKKPV